MNFEFTEEQKLFAEQVRRFALARLAQDALARAHESGFPFDVAKLMSRQGLMGVTIAQADGGQGGTLMDAIIAIEQIAAVCPRSADVVQFGNFGPIRTFSEYGTPAQKARWLPELLAGRMVLSLGMTEPDAGSAVTDLTTSARSDGAGYRIDGTKVFSTFSPDAAIFLIYVRYGPGLGGIGSVIVERGTPGFASAQKLDKLGMRGSSTSELVFEDCQVPAVNLLGAENGGVRVLMSGLDYERVVLAGGSLGLMAAALDLVLPYIRERRQFGQPVGTFELMQGKVADMYAALNAARAYVYAVARACDARTVRRRDAAACILFAAERATAAALDAIQALGGNGYINDYPAGRLLRDAKLYEIGAGTQEIRRMLIGRELFEAAA